MRIAGDRGKMPTISLGADFAALLRKGAPESVAFGLLGIEAPSAANGMGHFVPNAASFDEGGRSLAGQRSTQSVS